VPRVIPESRLKDLLECATRVFIEQGYRRTQVADVAQALGVAKGTVYLSVDSKEALFHAALRYADQEVPAVSELDLPLRPQAAELGAELRDRLAAEAIPPTLRRALGGEAAADPEAELEQIVHELFDASSRHRTAIKLLDRCGRDHPEIAGTFYTGGRFAQLDALARYLEQKIAAGALPEVADSAVAARFLIEVIATWAVHIHWDPVPQPLDPQTATEIVVQLATRALTGAAR